MPDVEKNIGFVHRVVHCLDVSFHMKDTLHYVNFLFFSDIGLIQNDNLNHVERQGMMDAFRYAIKAFNADQQQNIDKIELEHDGKTNVTDIDNCYQLTRQSGFFVSFLSINAFHIALLIKQNVFPVFMQSY
jgi:uncharacterized membrane protein